MLVNQSGTIKRPRFTSSTKTIVRLKSPHNGLELCLDGLLQSKKGAKRRMNTRRSTDALTLHLTLKQSFDGKNSGVREKQFGLLI